MNIVTLVNIFNCYGSILSMFPTNEKRKNCFLAACKILDCNVDLNEIDQKFPHGRRIGYGNYLLDFFLARSKIFRRHAILDDSAGAVKTTTDEGPDYCYMLPQLPSSCLLGHITGLFFCLYFKVCHPHIFKILDC